MLPQVAKTCNNPPLSESKPTVSSPIELWTTVWKLPVWHYSRLVFWSHMWRYLDSISPLKLSFETRAPEDAPHPSLDLNSSRHVAPKKKLRTSVYRQESVSQSSSFGAVLHRSFSLCGSFDTMKFRVDVRSVCITQGMMGSAVLTTLNILNWSDNKNKTSGVTKYI